MSLQDLYNKIVKKPQEEKGVLIKDNPFTLGSYVVELKTGKVLFSGDAISCAVFVNNFKPLV
jgi:hypothetical protein